MRPNLVKQALAAGRVQIGCGFAQLRSPEVARILKAAGFDWAFLDTEHGNFDLETIQDICRVASLVELTPIVRVADLQYHLVARAFDCGAEGVIFPRVEAPELLEKAVSWTKFPPLGIRGCGVSGMHVNYFSCSIPEMIAHFNEQLMVVLQIETVRAFDMRDELLSVKGVDCVMVGPLDLSISLGVPGEFQHPKMVETIDKIRESCDSHGVHAGIQTRNVAISRFWRDRGMLFIGCSSETAMLQEKASEIAKALR